MLASKNPIESLLPSSPALLTRQFATSCSIGPCRLYEAVLASFGKEQQQCPPQPGHSLPTCYWLTSSCAFHRFKKLLAGLQGAFTQKTQLVAVLQNWGGWGKAAPSAYQA